MTESLNITIQPRSGFLPTGVISNEGLRPLGLNRAVIKNEIAGQLQDDEISRFDVEMGPFLTREEIRAALPQFLTILRQDKTLSQLNPELPDAVEMTLIAEAIRARTKRA